MTLCSIQWIDCGGGGGSLLKVWPVGGVDGDGVAVGFRCAGPARGFFDIVAVLANALPVDDRRRSALVVRGDVVGVPDGGVAPGCSAVLVAGEQVLPHGVREGASSGVGVDQVPGVGVGVEPA